MPRNKEESHDELTPELVAEHKKLNQFHAATESKAPYHEFLVNFPLQAAVVLRTGNLAKQLQDAKEAAMLLQATNPKGPKRTGGIDRKPADGTRYAAIVEAVRSDSVEDVIALISAGVAIDSRSSSSRTALMYVTNSSRTPEQLFLFKEWVLGDPMPRKRQQSPLVPLTHILQVRNNGEAQRLRAAADGRGGGREGS
jgi:hypothetical protein